jgi:hypothetical protein
MFNNLSKFYWNKILDFLSFRDCKELKNLFKSKKYNYKVCIVCPTYNRRIFLPILIYQFNYQDYPKELLQLLILDDSDISNQDIIDNLDDELKSRIIYKYDNNKKPIGQKRNILNKMALENNAEYIVCFDDDDYYPSNRVYYAIDELEKKKYIIGGSSTLLIYYPKIDKIYLVGPFINKINYGHATNGTLVYHIKYLENNSYDDNTSIAEERKFLRNYKIPLLQLDYNNVMICMSHKTNTVDKNILKKNSNAKEIYKNINEYILDDYLLKFYKNLYNIIYI